MSVLWAIYIFGFGWFVGQIRHMKDGSPATVAAGILLGLAWPVVAVVAAALWVARPAGRS